MIKSGLLLFLFSISITLSAQVELSSYTPDFGIINLKSDRFVDVKIENTTDKKEFIFRIDAPRAYTILFSSKTLEPDSVRSVRIKYNPTSKGYFEDELKLHLSHLTEPITIKTKGFVEAFNPNSSPACPGFSDKNITEENSFLLHVEVIDKRTQKPINKSEVVVLHNGRSVEKLITDKLGAARKKVPLGLYYFIASADGYSSQEYPAYINRNNNYLLFELDKSDPPIDIDTTHFGDDIVITTPVEEEDPPVEEVPTPDTSTIVTVIDTSDFSINKFAPNNIVFLVDISSSMKYTGRLDLLKASMIELTEMLRPIDNITIVAYASDAQVLLETTSATDKTKIIELIEGLEAQGNTAGIEGMKLAYSKACNSFIHQGNNQIIMATDGGFNKGEGSVKRLASKYARADVKMSVVGIKVTNYNAIESMKSVAENGKGAYIPIKTYEDAVRAMKEEIKRQSSFGL